jgi:hypothetical protein
MSLNDDVDGWVAQLMQCKPLSEGEVKKLCEKVSSLSDLWAEGTVVWHYGHDVGATTMTKG